MNPPRAFFRAARARLGQAVKALTEATVEINGIPYAGALHLAPEGWELSERGPRLVQRMRVQIAKRELTTRPTRDQVVKTGGFTFRVTEITGDHPDCSEWDIQGMRVVETA